MSVVPLRKGSRKPEPAAPNSIVSLSPELRSAISAICAEAQRIKLAASGSFSTTKGLADINRAFDQLETLVAAGKKARARHPGGML